MVYLHQPPHEPYPIKGVLEAACHYLNSDSHQQRERKRVKDKDRSHSRHHRATLNDFVQRVFNGTHPHKQRRSRPKDADSDVNSDSDSDSGSGKKSSSDSDLVSNASSDSNPLKYKMKTVHFKQHCSSHS
jgi:hypothetical protein